MEMCEFAILSSVMLTDVRRDMAKICPLWQGQGPLMHWSCFFTFADALSLSQVLLEFKEYAQEVDVDFVRKVREGRWPLHLTPAGVRSNSTLAVQPLVQESG